MANICCEPPRMRCDHSASSSPASSLRLYGSCFHSRKYCAGSNDCKCELDHTSGNSTIETRRISLAFAFQAYVRSRARDGQHSVSPAA